MAPPSNRPKSLTIDEAISKLLDSSKLVAQRGEFRATEAKRVTQAFSYLSLDTAATQTRLQSYVKFLRRLENVAGPAMVALSAAALGQAAIYTMTDRVRTELPFSILTRKSDLQNDVLQGFADAHLCVGSTRTTYVHGRTASGHDIVTSSTDIPPQSSSESRIARSSIDNSHSEVRHEPHFTASAHSSAGSTYSMSSNGTLKLQVSLLPSEPPYRKVELSIAHLVSFLQGIEGLTNLTSTVALLQQYEMNTPSVQLKLPLYDAFPSIEIKVTRDLGSTLLLIFSWDIANDLVYSLGSVMANVAD